VISTVIQIGLALPMAEYFHRVSFTGVTANLIVMPLLEIVIPAGFLAILTGWHWVAAVSLSLLNLAAKTADWHARMEPSWRITDPPGWLAAAFVISLLAVAITVRHSTRSPAGSPGRESSAQPAGWRHGFSRLGFSGTVFSSSGFWRWPAGLAGLALFAVLLWQPWLASWVPHTLELTAIDVGQGDSLLVVFPEGRIMLIDGGGILSYGRARPPSLDIGEDVVSPYLWSRHIRRIDILAATHAHADHTGGLAAIMNNFRPRELWVGPNPLPSLVAEARHLGVQVKDVRAGPPFHLAGATVEVLSPSADYSSRSPGNNDSLALRIQMGRRAFLLAGDMERKMELEMLARAIGNHTEIHADVLKVGHHGSNTSTSQTFLDAVAPSVDIISAGFENSFGHPHPDVLSRLAKRPSAVLRTDLNGLVTVRTDGIKLWWDSNLQRQSTFADMFFRTFGWPSASIGQ
jgi:competence protein ComEC